MCTTASEGAAAWQIHARRVTPERVREIPTDAGAQCRRSPA